MKYIFGNFVLNNATIQVQHRIVRLGNSLLHMMVNTHNVAGKMRAATQSELHQQIGAFGAAFSQTYVDLVGLYFGSGAPTQHVIQTRATLDGIKLIDGPVRGTRKVPRLPKILSTFPAQLPMQ